MDKLISIVVPVYKAEKYLSRCVESLLSQTYKNTEIILVDDGSPDSSGSICDDYASKHNNIKVVHIKNGGPSNARNVGIDNATGDYLMFCDSDDWAGNNWCEEFIRAINRFGENHFFICGLKHIDNVTKDNYQKTVVYDEEKEYSHLTFDHIMDIDGKWLLKGLYIKILDLNIIKKNNIRFNTTISLGEDCMFVLEYLKHIDYDFVIINKPTYNYIQDNGESLWFKYTPNLYDILVLEQESMEQLFTIRNMLAPAAIKRYRQWCYMNIYRGFYNGYKNLSKADAINDFQKILDNPVTKANIQYYTEKEQQSKFDICLLTENAKKIYSYFVREKYLTKIYNIVKGNR